jgi:hypothetical protein
MAVNSKEDRHDKKVNMRIRNCHTQKTQPPHAAKQKRGKESIIMFIRILISNKTPQTINEKKKNPWLSKADKASA